MLDRARLSEALSRVMRPVAEANGLPNMLYTDPAALALERELIFGGGWACLGFEKDAAAPGDAFPVDFAGMPLLLARDREGVLRVFENVCRHRGMILVEEPRNFPGVIRCPYHSWCYSPDGALRATPHVGGPGINTHNSIDPATTGLREVRSGSYMGMVFVNLSGAAADFDTWTAPLRERWVDFEGKTVHHGSGFTLDVACNWKLAVENYCESYHLPWVHPGLNSYSRLEDHYHIEVPQAFSGQGTRVYAPDLGPGDHFPDFAALPPVWDKTAEYVALYPNVLIGVHRDHVFAILLCPQDEGHTLERVEIFYTTEEAAQGDAFAARRARNAALWKKVFEEDIFVVEGMQKGRHAPGFDGGRFSAVMDSPTHCFHDWVAHRLDG